MPKTPSPSKANRTARVESSSSPSKSSPRRTPKKRLEDLDKSQWRPSTLPEMHKPIGQTLAMKIYHISKNDLEGLPMETKQIQVMIGKVAIMRPKYEYDEREVEMRAWEKYGGPEEFEKMLNVKAEVYYDKHGIDSQMRFPKPTGYKLANPLFERKPRARKLPTKTQTQNAALPLPEPIQENPEIKLIQIKNTMEAMGENWLWDALTKQISSHQGGHELPIADRLALMQSASESLGKYPVRPMSPPPLGSASFRALAKVLAEAPNGYRGPGIEEKYNEREGTMTFDWKEWYKDKVYDRLNGVFTEHGNGGWEKARWLAYDKYVECKMGGLRYTNLGSWKWTDTAKGWLRPTINVT